LVGTIVGNLGGRGGNWLIPSLVPCPLGGCNLGGGIGGIDGIDGIGICALSGTTLTRLQSTATNNAAQINSTTTNIIMWVGVPTCVALGG
tara:strand:+ start:274 stop:543 length:270 start_codon:yes stop_codon:yes gene_type:complete